MTTVHLSQNSFTSGQLDPTLWERYEYQGYAAGAQQLDNFLVLPQGGVTRRPGSRYVGTAKNATATRLIPFVISPSLAYVLEVGAFYIRAYRGTTYAEIATSYLQEELLSVHVATYGAVMVFTHPAHPPSELVRLSDTEWLFRAINFAPPPTYEAGSLYAIAATLGATSGIGVSFTSATPVFLVSDIGRQIAEEPSIGGGRATITGYTSATVATVDIVYPFHSTSLLASTWRLLGTPNTRLKPDMAFPVGAAVALTAQLEQPDQTELVTDGNFPDLTNWSDFSGRDVVSGTASGGTDEELDTSTGNFITSGVRAGHRALNTTDSSEDTVLSVAANFLSTSKMGATWAAGKDYTIKQSGSVAVTAPGSVMLDGGVQGVAHLEQALTTVVGSTYRITFDVTGAPLSLMAGDSTDMSNVLQEFSYDIGNDKEATFKATSTTTVIAFRNNQNTVSTLSHVSVKQFDVAAWRGAEVGQFIRINNGLVEVTEEVNASVLRGIIRKSLDDDLAALPGAWTLESPQWSPTLGYPNTLAFQGGRLNYGGSLAFPNRLWGSRVGVYSDFGIGVNADDPYQFDLSANNVTTLRWLAGERGLIVGSDQKEFTVRGGVTNIITPTDVDVASPTGFGSAPIQPIIAPQAILFVPRSRRRLYENSSQGDYAVYSRQVEDRSITAENVTRAGIKAIAYQQEPRPVVWVVTDDGKLAALTYLREHVVAGWAAQTTAGTVKGVCCIPHQDGNRDQVWLLAIRTGTVPYIEYLDDSEGFYGQLEMDSGVVQTGSSTTITGLGHLDGLSVSILADGIQQPDQVVSGVSVTLDHAATVREAGLAFTPQLTTLRPTFQNTPLAGLLLSSVRVSLTFLNTLNAIVNGERINFGEEPTLMDSPQPLYSGQKEIETMGWDHDALITVVQDQPYPITVLNVTRRLAVENYSRAQQ